MKKIIFFGLIALSFFVFPALRAEAHFAHSITATTTIAGIPYMYVSHGDTGDWMPYFQKMVTKTVSKSTTWSAFAQSNAVTKNDIVSIPEGVTLVIDTATVPFHTLVVEGNLAFSNDKNTELRVGTLVLYPTGSLSIHPLSKNIKTVISFGGYTPYDPSQFTLGLIALGGTIDIQGTPAIGNSYSQISAAKGAKTIEVENSFHPSVGDEIIFSDSQSRDASNWSYSHYDISLVTAMPQQWEQRIVTAVNGTTVTLDKPFAYAHADYAADLTRNVIIRSDLGNSADISHRAHVMLAGPTKISIKNARFMDLGRTAALQNIDVTTYDASGNVIHRGTNNIGRYALHLHHVTEPFLIEGNVVTGSVVDHTLNGTIEHVVNGSPRWGIVNHDSSGDIKNNVVVGAAGAGIVGEAGTESGTVSGNIVIGTGQGTGGGDDGRLASMKGTDLGYGGFGYWFRGPFVNVENNIAAGYFKQGGFGYFLHPLFSQSQLPDVAGMPADLKGKNINVNSKGLRSFKNNKAVGIFGDAGFIMLYTSVPHIVSNFSVINRNINGQGFDVEYTQKLDIVNSSIQGFGGIALWSNKETKEINTPGTAISGFEQMQNAK